MKHKHKYYGYGKMDVPTGRWRVDSKEVRIEELEPGSTLPFVGTSIPVEITRPAIVCICRGCGDVKVKVPKVFLKK